MSVNLRKQANSLIIRDDPALRAFFRKVHGPVDLMKASIFGGVFVLDKQAWFPRRFHDGTWQHWPGESDGSIKTLLPKSAQEMQLAMPRKLTSVFRTPTWHPFCRSFRASRTVFLGDTKNASNPSSLRRFSTKNYCRPSNSAERCKLQASK